MSEITFKPNLGQNQLIGKRILIELKIKYERKTLFERRNVYFFLNNSYMYR